MAAVLPVTCGTALALHSSAGVAEARGRARREARTTRTGAAQRGRLPRSAYALRVTMVLQGAVFGASRAGVTALTEKHGAPAQAGLVYAARG
ncbi:hypothetical protein [Streptomyces sp. QHH-9511]|uniref:hypothetical protein n=1 Tax=Streptomyces sp. QHH-9511 TaxID=2684468 RepID=UPI0018E08F0F|nr:hypothetical protein [Streptomyces sp. QHH-9511]